MYSTGNNFPQYDIGFLVFILQDRSVLNTKDSRIYMGLMIGVWANNLGLDFAGFFQNLTLFYGYLWASLGLTNWFNMPRCYKIISMPNVPKVKALINNYHYLLRHLYLGLGSIQHKIMACQIVINSSNLFYGTSPFSRPRLSVKPTN